MFMGLIEMIDGRVRREGIVRNKGRVRKEGKVRKEGRKSVKLRIIIQFDINYELYIKIYFIS